MICLYYIIGLRDHVCESSKMGKNILLLRDFESFGSLLTRLILRLA